MILYSKNIPKDQIEDIDDGENNSDDDEKSEYDLFEICEDIANLFQRNWIFKMSITER